MGGWVDSWVGEEVYYSGFDRKIVSLSLERCLLSAT